LRHYTKALLRFSDKRTAAAFTRWAEAAAHGAVATKLRSSSFHRILLRMTNRVTSQAFRRWVQTAGSLRRDRNILSRVAW
jgi:hypothetical protein